MQQYKLKYSIVSKSLGLSNIRALSKAISMTLGGVKMGLPDYVSGTISFELVDLILGGSPCAGISHNRVQHPVSKPTNQNSTFEQVNNIFVSHNASVMAIKSLNLNPAAKVMAIHKVIEETTTTLMKMTPVLPTGTCCCNDVNGTIDKKELINNLTIPYQNAFDMEHLRIIHQANLTSFANHPDIIQALTNVFYWHKSRIEHQEAHTNFVFISYNEEKEDQARKEKLMNKIYDDYNNIFNFHEKLRDPVKMYKLRKALLFLRNNSGFFKNKFNVFPDKNNMYLYWALEEAGIIDPIYEIDNTGKYKSPQWSQFVNFFNDLLELDLKDREISNLAVSIGNVYRKNDTYEMREPNIRRSQCCMDSNYFCCEDNYDPFAAKVKDAKQHLIENVLN